MNSWTTAEYLDFCQKRGIEPIGLARRQATPVSPCCGSKIVTADGADICLECGKQFAAKQPTSSPGIKPSHTRTPRKGRTGKGRLAGKPHIKERDFQAAVIELAHLFGWNVAYFRPARVMRDGKEKYETSVGADGKGWPDLVLVRNRIIYVELKSDTGKLSPEQELWRDRILAAGGDWFCWRPGDIEAIKEVLK